MERAHSGKFAAYYNGGHKIPLADFVPLYQASFFNSAASSMSNVLGT